MRKLFVTCAVAGMLTSCGSMLTMNGANGSSSTSTTSTEVTETGGNTGLLGSLLSSLAGDDSAAANNDGTALTTGGVVSGLLDSVLEAFDTVDEMAIVGIWDFKGSAFVFESENVLASLGSDLVATQLEAKVNQYLAKFNIKEGSCSMTFNEDGSFVLVMGDRYVGGNYTLNKETKELTLTSGMFKTVANLVYDADTINLVYESEGLLRLLKGVGAKNSDGTLALLGGLFEKYDGLRIGLAFAKK